MKLLRTIRQAPRPARFPELRQQGGGYVLVIILSVIVICAIMTVVLFERVTVNTKSSSAYNNTLQAQSLSEMALQLIYTQIRDATTENQTASTAPASRDTWASQPGAVWRFSPQGDMRNIYKLYSAREMRTEDADLSGDVPEKWYQRKTEYTDLNEPVIVGSNTHYPIVDPTAPGVDANAKGLTEGFSIKSDAPLATSGNVNAAPMPTHWIYVLADGTLCMPDDPIITTANPAVGRFAFWTDDETTKVNINTAAPSTWRSHWDVPRMNTNVEKSFGRYQPAQNEYQRYPGHPAMVSLRPILGTIGGLGGEGYYALAPRYRWGGSEDSSKSSDVGTLRTPLLTNKQDRLYTSIEELLFGSKERSRTAITIAQAEKYKFFLTAQSRAPELNLFGQPRVVIWPVHEQDSDTRRTPYDRMIAFCGTVGGNPFYFTREDPLSPTHDYDGISRNRSLYSYLQRLTKADIPGFGGNFLSKYGSDRDQILTQIFDYIRCVNLNETYQERGSGFLSYTPDWKLSMGGAEVSTVDTMTGLYSVDSGMSGAGFVVPIEIGTTRGFGRFPVLSEVGLWFVKHQEPPPSPPSAEPPPPKPPQLEAMLVLETLTPAFGYMPWCGKKLQFEVVSSDVKMKVGSNEVNLFTPGKTEEIYYPPLLNGGQTMGGYDGAAYIAGKDGYTMAGHDGPPYPFFSATLDLADSDDKFSIVGGTVVVRILVAGVSLQTYTFNFPDANDLPMPVIDSGDSASGLSGKLRWWRARYENYGGWFMPLDKDVLHSMEMTNGDARLLAAYKEVPAEFFTEHEDYTKPQPFAHGIVGTLGYCPPLLWTGGTQGSYVNLPLDPPLPYAAGARHSYFTFQPKISSRITSLRSEGWSGDFDGGLGDFVAGPFINKPDEGMLDKATSTSSSVLPYTNMKWSLANGLFSPLRQIPSAVMFGSLPSGAKARIPWRTLLFSPNPVDPGHKGFESPADHLLLDLFTMPVVEPYAISEPLSTAGKINMNYAIAPFSYIRRASSWYSLFETLGMFALPDTISDTYRHVIYSGPTRFRVDIPKTLAQFDQKFAANSIFKSASEICKIFLVPSTPSGETLANVSNLNNGYWSKHQLTGDNAREKPYAELYPKLTTQSNTYRVHVRAQTLPRSGKRAGSADYSPTAEYRGSWLIERYLSSSDPRLGSGEGQTNPDTDCLNELYKFRVLQTQQFNP